MTILNLTQHAATPDQVSAGVCDNLRDDQAKLAALLTVPASELLADDSGMRLLARARQLAELAVQIAPEGCSAVMIGGLPALQAPLARALVLAGLRPVFAVSDRVVVEVAQLDGSVRKVSEFRHLGFVSATLCVDCF